MFESPVNDDQNISIISSLDELTKTCARGDISADVVINAFEQKTNKLDANNVGRLGLLLARYSFFGDRTWTWKDVYSSTLWIIQLQLLLAMSYSRPSVPVVRIPEAYRQIPLQRVPLRGHLPDFIFSPVSIFRHCIHR